MAKLRYSVAVASIAVILCSCMTTPRYDLRKVPHLTVSSTRLSDLTVEIFGETLRSKRVGILEHPGGRMFVVPKERLIEKTLFSVPLSPGRYEIYEWAKNGSTVACLLTCTQQVDLAWTNPETDHVSTDSGLSYLACDHRRFLIFPAKVKPAIDAELSDNSRFDDAFGNGNFLSVDTRGNGQGAYLTNPGLVAPTVYVGHDAGGEPVAVFLDDGGP